MVHAWFLMYDFNGTFWVDACFVVSKAIKIAHMLMATKEDHPLLDAPTRIDELLVCERISHVLKPLRSQKKRRFPKQLFITWLSSQKVMHFDGTTGGQSQVRFCIFCLGGWVENAAPSSTRGAKTEKERWTCLPPQKRQEKTSELVVHKQHGW